MQNQNIHIAKNLNRLTVKVILGELHVGLYEKWHTAMYVEQVSVFLVY